MSVLTWVKLTVCLWLLRKAVKIIGWLLLVAGAVAAWPVTLVAIACVLMRRAPRVSLCALPGASGRDGSRVSVRIGA